MLKLSKDNAREGRLATEKLGHEENEVQVARPNYTFCARDWWKLLENLYSDLRKSSMTCKKYD